MLKRLRLQFVAVIMVIVTIMLCTVFGMLYFFTRSSLEQESFAMMRAVPVGIMAPDRPLAPFARPGEQPEQVRLPFFVVQEAEDGTLTAAGVGYYDLSPGEAFDQTFLQELIQEVERVNRPSGELKQYHLRFLRVDAPFGQSVIFADTTSEQSTLNNLVKNCILIGVLCFFAFLGISIKLAAWTVKPVEWAWQQQRQFVSDASHELKTPLASIRLLADSILQNETMDQVTLRDFVSDIGTEADRLTRITEHLLALTRLDSLPAAETFPVDVSAVTRRALSMLAPVADAAGVALGSNLKDKCVVQGTEDDLYQICFNLLENGIKYNRPGGRVMAVVYRDGDQVLLEVSDTGVGIPEEDMPKVFNRFYRVDKARSRAAGGTGLGLSIVRDTVRRHGGWVTVRARQPEGSVFTVGFPAVPEKRKEGDRG